MGRALVSKLPRLAVNLNPRVLVDRLGRVIWPPVCLVCGQAAGGAMDCCTGCREDLPRMPAACRRCGLGLARAADLCGRCARRPPSFDATFAGFEYVPPVDGLIQRFKFNRDLAAGRVLAGLLAERLAASGAPRPDLMVPVPLNWRRRWRRGFNQAERLCQDLETHFGGIPWLPVLKRIRPTSTQSDLPAAKRAGNVRGAFAVARVPRGLRHVALVDDVMTTGSTLDECAAALKQFGVGRVDVWVVARA